MSLFNLHKETYTIDGKQCTCVANFANNTLRITARGFNREYSLDDYTNFDGNMRDFASTVIGA